MAGGTQNGTPATFIRTEALTALCIRQKINQLRWRQLFLGKHFVNSLIISALARRKVQFVSVNYCNITETFHEKGPKIGKKRKCNHLIIK